MVIKIKVVKMKYLGLALGIISLAMLSTFAIAVKSNQFENSKVQVVDLNPLHGHVTVKIPTNAVQIAPGVFDLGRSVRNGKIVQGLAFVDYGKTKGFAKPGTECGNGVCEQGENAKKCPADCANGGGTEKGTCFRLLAKGARWKTTEQYAIDPSNSVGLNESEVVSSFNATLNTWDKEVAFDIFGSIDASLVIDGADAASPDGKNEVLFANIEEGGAIAVTIVWGTFTGPISEREIVEWDIVFDDVDFDWSLDCTSEDCTSSALKMDFPNIATHEVGHALGLGHPSDKCTEETMFRFADFGETKKRTLESGDIAGINELY